MKPGDKLYDHISFGIRNCKIGVLLFSSGFCQSRFCLYELALMMESKKRVVPIFWDVKPSQLLVKDDGTYLEEDLQRFNWALEEAKNTVGLPFDSMTGYINFSIPFLYYYCNLEERFDIFAIFN